MKNKIGLLIVGIVIIFAGVLIWQNKTTAPTTTISPTVTKKSGFTMSNLAEHNSATSCYVVVANKVYNLTNWISQHPGGEQAILGLCGTDGTVAFTAQHGSSGRAQAALASFLIGDLIN